MAYKRLVDTEVGGNASFYCPILYCDVYVLRLDCKKSALQPDENNSHVAAPAQDIDAWTKHVPKDKPVYITAQGLFIYLEENDVKDLFQAIAKRFPGSSMMFDSISKWLSEHTKKGWKRTEDYTTLSCHLALTALIVRPFLRAGSRVLQSVRCHGPTTK